MLLPAPVDPTIAVFWPFAIKRVIFFMASTPPGYLKHRELSSMPFSIVISFLVPFLIVGAVFGFENMFYMIKRSL